MSIQEAGLMTVKVMAINVAVPKLYDTVALNDTSPLGLGEGDKYKHRQII